MDTNNRASKLVSDAMKGREIAKGELVHRLGYSNLNKGRRRLEDFLESGEADPSFIEKLRKIFPRPWKRTGSKRSYFRRNWSEKHSNLTSFF
jgi:hypothetical protein